MESKSSLTFSFCGEYEVSAMALSNAIKSLVDLSSVVAKSEFPDAEFRLSVKAVTPGSLKFDFVATAIAAAQVLLAPGAIEYAANLIDIISSAFSIKKFLKGKPPQKVQKENEKIIITNSNGAKLEAPAQANVYFVDNSVDNSISNIILSAKMSEGVTGISLTSNNKIVEISREEFQDCSNEIVIHKEQQNSITKVRQKETLFIRQADFSGTLMWRFLSDQNFTASMEDKEFQRKITSGEIVLSAKSYIVADVKVTTYLNDDGIPSESKPMYSVLKVYSIHTAGEGQTKLNV